MDLVTRSCRACGSSDELEAYLQPYSWIAGHGNVSYVQRIVTCRRCGFTYSNPSPSDTELERHYAHFSNYENPQRDGRESLETLRRWERVYGFVAGRRRPRGTKRLLEIGCATGSLLAVFRERGWQVLGLDPAPGAAALARELYGVEVRLSFSDLEAAADRAPFDVIVLSHVVEHLLAPDAILRAARPLLARNGLVYVEVPNLARPLDSFGYFTFEHLNYFTSKTLTRMMAACNFAVDHLEEVEPGAVEPAYPVIAATFGRARGPSPAPVASDFERVTRVVADWVRDSAGEVARLQQRIDRVVARTRPGRLAIWGAGIHTSQLLAHTSLGGVAIARIFDSDPKKHGHQLHGVEISGLGDPAEMARLADCILISSRSFEDEIYARISHLERYGVRIERLYAP